MKRWLKEKSEEVFNITEKAFGSDNPNEIRDEVRQGFDGDDDLTGVLSCATCTWYVIPFSFLCH